MRGSPHKLDKSQDADRVHVEVRLLGHAIHAQCRRVNVDTLTALHNQVTRLAAEQESACGVITSCANCVASSSCTSHKMLTEVTPLRLRPFWAISMLTLWP